jgi:glucose/arabinose dehydrogenase
VHLSATGKRLGRRSARLPGDPYDLQVAPDGSVLVLESGAAGDIVRIDGDGSQHVLTRVG